jgi:sensor histidine kinase regulating citrate/malate metabolism
MMDGAINLDYSYNSGACFKIEIPIKQDGEKQ